MSFEDELRKVFIDEVTQLIQDAEECFLALEANPNDISLIDKIFRLAHNIKGGSKAVGFDELGIFSHEFESFLLRIKNHEIPVNEPSINMMLKCNDQIKYMVDTLRTDFAARFDNAELTSLLKAFIEEALNPQAPALAEPEFVEQEIAESNELLHAAAAFDESESIVEPQNQETSPEPAEESTETAKPTLSLVTQETSETPSTTAPATKKVASAKAVSNGIDDSIRVSLSRLEKLLNYIGEMVILQSVLNEQSFGDNPLLLRKTIQEMSKITKEVQDIAMSLRMIPLKQTFQKMQRIARDSSTLLGKRVQLQLVGEETEVDKTVLENLSDPLVHIVRNAVDHGIESPEERRAKGKNEVGSLAFRAYHQGGKLVIEIADDGGGINPEKLVAKAKEKGVLGPDAQLSRQEAINLIFHPGFSSKNEVTEISGRGVGMDVVRSNIEKMNGEVHIDTEVDRGSTFKIILPLTLAIIDGLVIVSDGNRFVVPLAHVAESVRIAEADIKHTTGLGDILLLRGENIPLIHLPVLLGRKTTVESKDDRIAIILRNGGAVVAVAIDDIIAQQQIVIKKMGNELQDVRGFSGSSVLGDGRPALILELSELLTQYESKSAKPRVDGRRVSA